jgi:hypothetical protein
LELLKSAAQSYSVKLSDPGFLVVKSQSNEIASWKEKIKNDCAKNGAPQIIVIFFNNYE